MIDRNFSASSLSKFIFQYYHFRIFFSMVSSIVFLPPAQYITYRVLFYTNPSILRYLFYPFNLFSHEYFHFKRFPPKRPISFLRFSLQLILLYSISSSSEYFIYQIIFPQENHLFKVSLQSIFPSTRNFPEQSTFLSILSSSNSYFLCNVNFLLV